jgi:hypothetical protein
MRECGRGRKVDVALREQVPVARSGDVRIVGVAERDAETEGDVALEAGVVVEAPTAWKATPVELELVRDSATGLLHGRHVVIPPVTRSPGWFQSGVQPKFRGRCLSSAAPRSRAVGRRDEVHLSEVSL